MYTILRSIFKKNITCHYYKSSVKHFTSDSIVLDEHLAKHLETVSLVGFSKDNGFEVLNASVKFASCIISIDTTKVQPLVTVLETWYVKVLLNN